MRNMIGARREHHQRLDERLPALGRAFDHELADILRARRAAGLARNDRLDAMPLQFSRQQTRLCRFAGALAAFERDEPAAFRHEPLAWPDTSARRPTKMRPKNPVPDTL